jgi:hypothetical protein
MHRAVCLGMFCVCSAIAQQALLQPDELANSSIQIKLLTATLRGRIDASLALQVRETAKARAALLRLLFERDPKTALQVSLSDEERAHVLAIAPDAAENIEQHGKWEGPVEIAVADDFKTRTSRTIYLIRANGESLDVAFAEDLKVTAGDRIRAEGIRLGNRVAARSAVVLQPSETAAALSAIRRLWRSWSKHLQTSRIRVSRQIM